MPYDCNADEPYDHWSELIEDNEDIFKRKWKHHPIKLKTLYFETNYWEKLPCTDYSNNPYSVEMINNKQVPWIETDDYKIYAGTTYEDFIEIIEKYHGKIFLEKGDD